MQWNCYYAGVGLCCSNGGSLDDVDMFQRYFFDKYQIIVYVRVSKIRQYEKIYVGPTAKRKIFIRFEDNHYDAIDGIASFLGGR